MSSRPTGARYATTTACSARQGRGAGSRGSDPVRAHAGTEEAVMANPAVSDIDNDLMSALRRLRAGRSRKVPYIQQLEAADCGAACLAMVLAYHGAAVPLERVRVAAGTNRGSHALAMLNGAEQFGLRGRGVRLDIDGLRHLPRASILHWDFNHFVVLERVRRSAIDIVD